MLKVLSHIGLLLLLALPVVSGEGDAGRETPFTIGAGARSLGMGGSYTALADDASSIYYNPAGVSRLNYQELSFMHAMLFEGTSFNFASWVIPVTEKSGIGFGFMRIGTDEIIRRDDFVNKGTFDYASSQVMFSYGQELFEGLATGVSLKVINQSIDNFSDYAYGADVGMSVVISDHLSIGVIGRDLLAPELQLNSYSETTPWSVTGGMALRDLTVSDHATLTASLDLEKPKDRSVKVHAGAEMTFEEVCALRAGFDRDNFAFGAGLSIRRLRLDYAYRLMDYVDDSHRFSLTFMIGPSAEERYRPHFYQPDTPVPDENQIRFLQLKEQGDAYFRHFQFDSALVYYNQALEFEPGNQDILETIDAIAQARRNEEVQQERLRAAEDGLRNSIARYYTQASNFFDKKYYSAALDLLELILETDPRHQDAITLKDSIYAARTADVRLYLEQAQSAKAEGKIVETIEAYNRILDLDASNAAIIEARRQAIASLDLSQQRQLGIDLFTQGRLDEARRRFNSVLRVNPGDPVAKEYLEKLESAQAEASTLEDLQRDRRIWNLYLEGIRHMRNGEYQMAIEAWEEVLEAYPNNANTLDNLEQARLRLQSGQSQ